ncbi:MAG: stealth family protein [Parachlamydiaceae bacterium]|nr:stealth family protein [Parachlamydiaceae bacterium]
MFMKSLAYIFVFLCLAGQIAVNAFDNPIDVVYLWVDGNDTEWQKIKNECEVTYQELGKRPDANASNRYSDHDELKYSLRSVLKYAPFVNHIYIVTMNQKPKWLLEHPKITIIDHKDIFLNQEHLPTFNSMAIESNLHRIPNLSEHFIYFNDDMFFGNLVTPSDFFTETGKIKVLFEKDEWLPEGPPHEKDITYWAACKNTNNLLNQCFNYEKRRLICHAPYALIKSYMKKTAQYFSEAFTLTSSHKFRCFQDYAITNGLLQCHWEHDGKVKKGKLTNMMLHFYADDKIQNTLKHLKRIESSQPHTFCLQDKMFGNGEKTMKILHNFFENWYPEPAPWETQLPLK